MTYFSRSYYSGDGTTKDFNVGFSYLDKSHIKVYLNGTLNADWTWLTASSLRMTIAPANGVIVLIKRLTSQSSRLVDYVSPSSLNEDDLDNDSLQGFYLAQEAIDQANSGVADDPNTGQFTANNKRIVNVADPVDDQDVVTKNWATTSALSAVAQATAKALEAATSASGASASATSAASFASTATARAGEASASASSASGGASTATTKAAEAASSASSAASSSTVATTRASESNTSAVAAAASAVASAASAATSTTKAGEAGVSATAAAASAAAAAASAGSLTPVQDQINGATDAAFLNADMLVARRTSDGALIKRSWGSTLSAIAQNLGSLFAGSTAKATPIDADGVAISDSAAAYVTKFTTFTQMWSNYFKAKADALYLAVANVATGANFRANVASKVLDTTGVWASAAEVTLTDAATIAVDFATFINAGVTLGGNRTLGAPTNLKNGQSGYIRVAQDATGGRTLAFNAAWKFENGTAPVLSTGSGKWDVLFYQVISGVPFISAAKDMR